MRKVYHKILHIAGNVITVEADDVAYNELAEVRTELGSSLAQVIRLDGRKVSLQVFAGSRGIGTDDQVRFLGRQMEVSSSDALLGRVFNGRGAARDHRPEITDEMIEIGAPTNQNGYTECNHYQLYAPLKAGSKVQATCEKAPNAVKFDISPVVAGRATVKATYNGKEKIFLIN